MKILMQEQTVDGKKQKIHLSKPIIFWDNEKNGRSGHIGHAMTEFAPGKILAFAANTSKIRAGGHSAFGWMEYKISEDYGKTWSEAEIFPYSWETFLYGEYTVSVEKAITCNDGTIAAFCLMNSQYSMLCCEPWARPRVVLSHDFGRTWEEAFECTAYRGRIYDALYYKGVAYILQFCNEANESFTGNKPEHVYRLFKSEDNCKSFEEVCVIPFESTLGRGYGNMIITPEGKLIVYAYNLNDEQNMDYIVSEDFGKTWGKSGVCFLEKRIRNPQVGILDGQYILHGRAGKTEAGTAWFVLYTSANGIEWDAGTVLIGHKPASFYSSNLTITMPSGKQRMFVKYSENYGIDPDDPNKPIWDGKVNSMLFTIDTVE